MTADIVSDELARAAAALRRPCKADEIRRATVTVSTAVGRRTATLIHIGHRRRGGRWCSVQLPAGAYLTVRADDVEVIG